MEKKDLIACINGIFLPMGFKRKGNYWVYNGNEISKIVNLQKSNFGNSFYINYGYNFPDLKSEGCMHIYNRLAATTKVEQKDITDLLDLECQILDEQRLHKLKLLIQDKIVTKFNVVSTKEDIIRELRMRPHLNDITLSVKAYLHI